MPQTLAKSAAEERLRWLQPYLNKKKSLKEIAELSPFSYRTLKRWVAAYMRNGEAGLAPVSRRPHSHPKQFSRETIQRIRKLRIQTDLGPDVLVHLLAREGVQISARGIAKVLKKEGLSRRRVRLAPKEKWVPTVTLPGELMEIDVVYVRKFKGRWLYQFTAIDCATRWRHLWVTPEQSNRTTIQFLDQVIARAPFRIRAIKTDNASIFTNRYVGYPKSADPSAPRVHVFDQYCEKRNIAHYLIAPGKPQQNGKVERSHRNDRERFWDKVTFKTLDEIRKKHGSYARWYNEICPHLALNGMTPVEKLQFLQGTNVRT